jgi:DNA polymerase-3 subunit delta
VVNGITLLLGKEEFLKREFIEELRRRFFPRTAASDANYQEFDLGETSFKTAAQFLETLPFLSEKRVAIVRGLDRTAEDEKEAVLAFADRFPSTAVLVLVSDESSVKKDDFLRRLSEKVRTVACHTPFDRDLPGWVQARARKIGIDIDREALPVLTERCGRDLAAIHSALEQLSLGIHPRNRIERCDAESFLGRSVHADVFSLVDAFEAGRATGALEILEALFREDARGYEIVAVLAAQFEKLKKVSVLKARGLSDREIGAELKVHPLFLSRLLRQARAIPSQKLGLILAKLLECDHAVKTGVLEEKLALERFVFEACGVT